MYDRLITIIVKVLARCSLRLEVYSLVNNIKYVIIVMII